MFKLIKRIGNINKINGNKAVKIEYNNAVSSAAEGKLCGILLLFVKIKAQAESKYVQGTCGQQLVHIYNN